MEFRFNLNEIFRDNVVEVDSTLIPPGFKGDKRALWDTQAKVSQIVNAMGEASARAQSLTKPITTADRLRNSEHKLYLLVDGDANNGKGAVTGMLKTGEKALYVFDRQGQHYKVSPCCVLDFYVPESLQRSGYGKKLFEHMLQREKNEPVKLAIDRPSDKFLGFLKKHYNLDSPIKQMNNYVVFDGFFPGCQENSARQLQRTSESEEQCTPGKKSSANGLQSFQGSPYGRYGAPRPPCSMGQIIHNETAVVRNQEPSGVQSAPAQTIQSSGQQSVCSPCQVTQSSSNMHQSCHNQPPQNVPQPAVYQYQQQIAKIPQNIQQTLSGDHQIPPQQQGYTSQNQSHPTQQQPQYTGQLQPQYHQTYQGQPIPNQPNNNQIQYRLQNQYQSEGQDPQITDHTQLQGQISVEDYDQYQNKVQPCSNQIQNQEPCQERKDQGDHISQNQQYFPQQQPSVQQPQPNQYQAMCNNMRQPQYVTNQKSVREPLLPQEVNTDRTQYSTPQVSQSAPNQSRLWNNQPHTNENHHCQNQPRITQDVPCQSHAPTVCQSMPNQAIYVQSQHQGENDVQNYPSWQVRPVSAQQTKIESRIDQYQSEIYPSHCKSQVCQDQPSIQNQPQGQVCHNQPQNQPQSQVYQPQIQLENQPQVQVYQPQNQCQNQPQGQVYQLLKQPEGQVYQNQPQVQIQNPPPIQNQLQGQVYQNQPQIQPQVQEYQRQSPVTTQAYQNQPQIQPQVQVYQSQPSITNQPEIQAYQSQPQIQPQVQVYQSQPSITNQPEIQAYQNQPQMQPQSPPVYQIQPQAPIYPPQQVNHSQVVQPKANQPQNSGDAPQIYPNGQFNGMQSSVDIQKNQPSSKSVPNVPATEHANGPNDLRCASVFPIQGGQNAGHGGQKSILSMPTGGFQRGSRVTSGLDINQRTKNATKMIKLNECPSVPKQNFRSDLPEFDISKGYPPQSQESRVVEELENPTNQKAERPHSLEIQPIESQNNQNGHEDDDLNNEVETLENPSNDDEILKIEKDFEKSSISPRGSTPGSIVKSPNYTDAAGMASSGRNTPPGLTGKGYFDLKFYHNKLW